MWRDALAAFDPADALTLKRDRGTAVYRSRLAGRDVVVKRWDLLGVMARLKALLRWSRAHRHWNGAKRLTSWGVRTAAPLALLTNREHGSSRTWLVLEALQGRTVLDHMAARDLGLRQEHAVADAVGGMVSRLRTAGGFNRDGKPSNLIVTLASDEDAVVAVVDCVAIGRARGERRLAQMLASLYIEPLGCGCPPRLALAMRVVRGVCPQVDRRERVDAVKRLWRAAASIVTSHGDPTPRVSPLREPASRR